MVEIGAQGVDREKILLAEGGGTGQGSAPGFNLDDVVPVGGTAQELARRLADDRYPVMFGRDPGPFRMGIDERNAP